MSDNAPWEDYPDIWKNKTAYFTWLRGSMRRIWSKSPLKIKFIQANRFRIPSPRGKKYADVWGGKCSSCGNTFQQKELQVDHLVEAGSLRGWEDFDGFGKRLLAPMKGDLQLVCKPCHKIITHSQKKGLSFEEASIEVGVIAKCKLPPERQKEELLEAGFTELEISNAPKRRVCYTKLLKEGRE